MKLKELKPEVPERLIKIQKLHIFSQNGYYMGYRTHATGITLVAFAFADHHRQHS